MYMLITNLDINSGSNAINWTKKWLPNSCI